MATITVKQVDVYGWTQIKSLVFAISFFAFTYISDAQAADWKLTPTIDLTETFTDNVRLAKKEAEESAYITQLSPGLSVVATGPRLKLNANYVMQNLYYSNLNSGTISNHLLKFNARAALIENLFFLDGNASITQQNQTPFGQVAENDLNLSNNRVEVRSYSASPYFRRNFDNNFTGEFRYIHDAVISKTTNKLIRGVDGEADSLRFSLNSGSAFKTFHWGVNYSKQNIHSDNQAPLDMEMSTVNLGVRITPLFGLTSAVGYEKNSYISLGEKPTGTFWTAGFGWTPTERTKFIFNAGKRFYGNTYALTLSQRARSSVWSLGYNEDITTTRGQFLIPATNDTSAFLNQLWQNTIPDASTRQQAVNNFIRDSGLSSALAQPINTFTNQVFLQKSLQGAVAFTGAQNTVLLNLFNTLRDTQSAGGLDAALTPGLLGKVRQTGVSALWNWRLSPRTNATISTSFNRAESISLAVTDNTKTLRASLSRQLQAKLKASLEARRTQKDSTSTSVSGNFNENSITLYLLLGF